MVTTETRRHWCQIDTNYDCVCGAPVTHEVVLPDADGYYSCKQHIAKAVDKLLAGGADYVKVRRHNS